MTGPGPLAGGRKSSPVGRSGTQAVAPSGAKLGGPSAANGGATAAPRQSAARAPARTRIGRRSREARFDIEAPSLVLPSAVSPTLRSRHSLIITPARQCDLLLNLPL